MSSGRDSDVAAIGAAIEGEMAPDQSGVGRRFGGALRRDGNSDDEVKMASVMALSRHVRSAAWAHLLAMGCSLNSAGLQADAGVDLASGERPAGAMATGGGPGSGGRTGGGGGAGANGQPASTGGAGPAGGVMGTGGVQGTGGVAATGGAPGLGGTGGATGDAGGNFGGTGGTGSPSTGGSSAGTAGSPGTGAMSAIGGAVGATGGVGGPGGTGGFNAGGSGGSNSICIPYPEARPFQPPNDDRVHCYWFHAERQNWPAARIQCEREGGNLATILSPEENAFLVGVARFSSAAPEFWIGGTDGKLGSDRTGVGPYRWVTNEPWGYTNWNATTPAQPDGFCDPCNNGQPCTCDHRATLAQDGTWFDFWQDNPRGFLCEVVP